MSFQSKLVLKNAHVVLPGRVIEHGSVVTESGLIAAIEDENARAEAMTLDLSGAVLLPGFIDVHIHGAMGVDVMEAAAGDLGKASTYLAAQGVTGWLPTFVPASDENYVSAVAAISQARGNEGARVLGVHYEGPFVNTAQCGALHTDYFKTYSGPRDLDFLHVPDDSVRMITLAPEISGGLELVRELNSRGWVISIGHTRADLKILAEACDAGARHMTHFMNAMAPLHHRSPGPIAFGLS
ncbi:MAG TPA: amidohydrolase family protein, partial [Pyrinomonadaceae bacterium]|nr:amidohydrolase family protein [Pyrinomonadaceae bacterium]